MVHRNSVACITDTWRGLQRSSQPGSDSNYHAADIHVDESFNGNWPNKDFDPGRPYKHVNDKGNLPVDQNFDAGLSNANCTAENRKGEEKTSIGTQEAKGYRLPTLPPSRPWTGKRGSGRVLESRFPLRGSSRPILHYGPSGLSTTEASNSLEPGVIPSR